MKKSISKFSKRIALFALVLFLFCGSSVLANSTEFELSVPKTDSSNVTLTWENAASDYNYRYKCNSYTVQRKAVTDIEWSTLATVEGNSYSDEFSYTDQGIPFGTSFEYRILATVVNSYDSDVEPIDMVSNVVIGGYTSIAAPNVYTVDGGPSTLEVKWDAVEGVSGYEVYSSKSEHGSYKLAATINDPAATSWMEKGLSPSALKYYVVKAFVDVNGIRYAGEGSEPFPGGTNGVVYSLTVKKTDAGNVKVSWVDPVASPDYDGDYYFESTKFVLYKKTSVNKTWKVVKTKAADNYDGEYSYTDTNVPYGVTVYYKLAVTGKTEWWGDDYKFDWETESKQKSIKAAKVKAPKAKVAATNNSTSLKVSWSKVKGASGYQVYASKTKNGKYTLVKTIKSGKTVSWTHKGLKTGAKRYYKVKSYGYRNGKKYVSDFSNRVYKKVTKNQKVWYPSSSFDEYGGPNLRDKSVSYVNGKLQYKALVLNDRIFYASKFDWIRISIYADGKLIGQQKFYDRYIGLDGYDMKYMTFKLNKGTKRQVNLRDASISVEWQYYYTYNY